MVFERLSTGPQYRTDTQTKQRNERSRYEDEFDETVSSRRGSYFLRQYEPLIADAFRYCVTRCYRHYREVWCTRHGLCCHPPDPCLPVTISHLISRAIDFIIFSLCFFRCINPSWPRRSLTCKTFSFLLP